MTHRLDLGVGDVHVDGPVKVRRVRRVPTSEEIATMVRRSKRPILHGDIRAIAMGFSVVDERGDLVPAPNLRIPTGPLPPDASSEDPGTWVSLDDVPAHYTHIDFTIPASVREEAKRGLDWHKEHGRGGTQVGIATARTLVSSGRVSPEKARHIARYFPRHEVDKRGKGWAPGSPGYPSNGRIAWALWGGDAGRTWSNRLVRQMDAADAKNARDTMTTTTLADLTTQQRKALKPNQFALPSLRKFPIHDAAHTRAAASRLEQAKKARTVTPAQYAEARRNIARAAKRFGIESQYLERDAASTPNPSDPPFARPAPTSPKHLRFSFTTPHGHRVEVAHTMSDRPVYTDAPIQIDASSFAARVRLLDEVETKAKSSAEGSDERKALETEAARLRDEIAAPTWNQIAKVGIFRGHPAGPFELSPQVFDQIIANYRNIDGGKVPIDFEHASEADESSGSIPQSGAPAQGWILDLQNRGADGLWGLCRFFEPALTYVREGKYPFFSPAIRFGAKHPETGQPIGARLTSVALVTRPFLRNMQPLAARDSGPGDHPMSDIHPVHEKMRTLKAALALHPLATYADMKDHVGKLREHAEKADLLDKPHAHAIGVHHMGVHMGDFITPMAEAIGAADHMTVAQILDAVEEMIDAAMERHEAEYHTMSGEGAEITLGDGDVAVQLGQAKEKLRVLGQEKTALAGQVRTLTSEKAQLTLSLQQKSARVLELEAAIATKDGEIRTLRDAETARAEAAIDARVAEAFETYKDAHKLTDAHRKMMKLALRDDPAAFETMYPPVAPNMRHMLRDLTGSRTPGAVTAPHVRMGDRAAPVTAPGMSPGATTLTPADQVRLTDKLVTEKKMSREQAISYAYQVAIGHKPMPSFAS